MNIGVELYLQFDIQLQQTLLELVELLAGRVGFDLEAVPPDRKGVSESIVGRMQRHGGLATIHTAPGSGTEVELELPRSNAGAASPASELSRT